jgi:hypothetical protein
VTLVTEQVKLPLLTRLAVGALASWEILMDVVLKQPLVVLVTVTE